MTGLDKTLGIVSLVCLGAFLYVLGSYALEPDLIIILVIGTVMAGYDFWLELFARKPDNGA
jgi:hypothetical protein